MNQMRELVSSTKKTILDARPKGRFEGTAPEPREGLPSGHLPGSYNVPYSELLTPDGHLKSVEDLQPLLSHHLGKQAVATCGSGVTAAVIALAMARLGDWDVAVYDGSWAEWASHLENPIEVS